MYQPNSIKTLRQLKDFKPPEETKEPHQLGKLKLKRGSTPPDKKSRQLEVPKNAYQQMLMTGGFGNQQQQKTTKLLEGGSQIRNITQSAVLRQQAIDAARDRTKPLQDESRPEASEDLEEGLDSTGRFLSKLYADDRFLRAKLEDQQLELALRETKKESKGLIDEMDQVLNDLAQWKLSRR